MMYKKWLLPLGLLIIICGQAQSLTAEVQSKPSLQRGAKIFMNYCSGCHSLKYLRYNHMAEGLGLIGFDGRIDEDLLKNNLIFTQSTIHDPIRIALPPEDAKQWFGVVPPDLSLIAREKGVAWIYAYLNSFYSDSSRPFGVNNVLSPGVVMPNVLEPLLGEKSIVEEPGHHSGHLLLRKEGTLSQAQINLFLQDLVTFLAYVGEPAQTIRYRLGLAVITFLLVFFLAVISLKRMYWRKIARTSQQSNPKG